MLVRVKREGVSQDEKPGQLIEMHMIIILEKIFFEKYCQIKKKRFEEEKDMFMWWGR